MALSGRKPMLTCIHAAATRRAPTRIRNGVSAPVKRHTAARNSLGVKGDGSLGRAAAQRLWKFDMPLEDVERRAAGAGQPALVKGVVNLGVGQSELKIPERARAKHRATRLDGNLPVETGQRLLETRVRRHLADLDLPRWRTTQAADKLVQFNLEPGIDPALDMPLEQPSEAGRCERKRQDDGDGGGDEEPDAERCEAHAGSPPRT